MSLLLTKPVTNPNNYSDAILALTQSVNDAFPLLYKGYTIDVQQSEPIKQSNDGSKTGCTWAAVLNPTTADLTKPDTVPIQPNDARTPGQICEQIMATFASSNYYNTHPEAVGGQSGSQPYSVPKIDWSGLPGDKGDPDYMTRPYRTDSEISVYKAEHGL